jgi:hypothetical protein
MELGLASKGDFPLTAQSFERSTTWLVSDAKTINIMELSFLLNTLAFVLVGVCYASFAEWSLHRFVMHKPLSFFQYPYKAHHCVHHRLFKADHSYHLEGRDNIAYLIPMAWWNGPVLIVVASSPWLLASWLTGFWPMVIGAAIAIGLYYATYEYLHWCMHLPKERRVEKAGIFYRLNGHHLLHHRYMHRNFNVVFPLADFLLGTLMLRSKVKFAQATAPQVPDVQPMVKKVALSAS